MSVYVTQEAVEVLKQDSNHPARVTQVAVEVMKQDSIHPARVSQLAVEVLLAIKRPRATDIFAVAFDGAATVTAMTGGTAALPVICIMT